MYGFVLFSTLLSICLSVCPPASLSGFISLMVIYLSFSLRGVNDKPVEKSKACHHRNIAQLLIFWLAERSKLVAPKQMIIGLIWWTGDKTCVNIFCLWIKKRKGYRKNNKKNSLIKQTKTRANIGSIHFRRASEKNNQP